MQMNSLVATGIVITGLVSPVQAQEPANFHISGFASLIGGKVLGGATDAMAAYAHCRHPCYVADWSNGGVYDRKFSLNPESRMGVQGTYVFNQTLSATAQITSRAMDSGPRLEWGFLSAKFGNWDLQLGRKRIPLYFYPDFQDVGIAYPWVSPPPDLYGWEVTNYNGASLRYRGSIDGLGVSGSMFAGSEHVKDSGLYRIYETAPVDIRWTKLVGADLELSKHWWTLRFAYAQNDMREHYRETNANFDQKMKAYSMAFNADFGDWFCLGEIGDNARRYVSGADTRRKILSLMGGVGYRYGQWTPMITVSRLHEHAASADYEPDRWNTFALNLRYDLGSAQAVKVQLNKTQDTKGHFTGNTSTLRVNYDVQF
jgi:hypothetical protein